MHGFRQLKLLTRTFRSITIYNNNNNSNTNIMIYIIIYIICKYIGKMIHFPAKSGSHLQQVMDGSLYIRALQHRHVGVQFLLNLLQHPIHAILPASWSDSRRSSTLRHFIPAAKCGGRCMGCSNLLSFEKLGGEVERLMGAVATLSNPSGVSPPRTNTTWAYQKLCVLLYKPREYYSYIPQKL